MPLWGGVEAGGTKFICGVGTKPDDIRAEIRIPTTTPQETICQVIDFFHQQEKLEGTLEGIGIGSFGPLDPNPNSPTFGYLKHTPKHNWVDFDFVGAIKREFNIPIGFDTDVNAAVLGEYRWGNAQELDTFIYITVGTGIGGGGMVNGKLMHGLLHPEMGHIFIPHDLTEDPFTGCCPFHNDCLEGLASGLAIEKRWGKKATSLPPEHPAWFLEANYLALGLVNFILILSPQKIIMGGGVMNQKQLFPLIRSQVQKHLSSYLKVPKILNEIENYILPAKLGNKAGLMGAFALAEQAVKT